jgi:hypothetical protein
MSGKRINSPVVMRNKQLPPYPRAFESSPVNPVFKGLQNYDSMVYVIFINNVPAEMHRAFYSDHYKKYALSYA